MAPKALREYFDVLSMFADSKVARIDQHAPVDFAKVQGLFAAGCLIGHDMSDIHVLAYEDVTLSAHGAEVLARWQAIIERASFRARLMEQVEKAVWLVAGALITGVITWLA